MALLGGHHPQMLSGMRTEPSAATYRKQSDRGRRNRRDVPAASRIAAFRQPPICLALESWRRLNSSAPNCRRTSPRLCFAVTLRHAPRYAVTGRPMVQTRSAVGIKLTVNAAVPPVATAETVARSTSFDAAGNSAVVCVFETKDADEHCQLL